MSMLTTIFCHIDDFCKHFEPLFNQQLINNGQLKRNRATKLTRSEMMTICVYFHHCRFRDFKAYYLFMRQFHLQEFPTMVSYNRFVELMPRLILPLTLYLNQHKAQSTGLAFIDSTPLKVCHNRRISQHKVFKGIAKRGKSSMGWFFGFKLHVLSNHKGELISCRITAGNVDDRRPVLSMVDQLYGYLIADKGYLSKTLQERLLLRGICLVTKLRKNMKERILPEIEALLLKQRSLIENVIARLKLGAYVEHSRYRSISGFMVNVVSALIEYMFKQRKPSVNWQSVETAIKLIP